MIKCENGEVEIVGDRYQTTAELVRVLHHICEMVPEDETDAYAEGVLEAVFHTLYHNRIDSKKETEWESISTAMDAIKTMVNTLLSAYGKENK